MVINIFTIVLNLIWNCFLVHHWKKIFCLVPKTLGTAPADQHLSMTDCCGPEMVSTQKKSNLRSSQIKLSHFCTVTWTSEQHPKCFVPANERPYCILLVQRFWTIWLEPTHSENASGAWHKSNLSYYAHVEVQRWDSDSRLAQMESMRSLIWVGKVLYGLTGCRWDVDWRLRGWAGKDHDVGAAMATPCLMCVGVKTLISLQCAPHL